MFVVGHWSTGTEASSYSGLMTGVPPPGTRSPDGKFVWDGQTWKASLPPDPPEVISPDGKYRWNSHRWVPIWTPPGPSPPPKTVFGIPVALLAIAIIAYLAYHAYRYHNCAFPPGVFEWPSICL